MKRSLRSLVWSAFAAIVIAACSGCGPKASGCSAACAQGCTISADCKTCTPTSPNVSFGLPCSTGLDCCTGSCVNGACTEVGGGSGSTTSGSGSGTTGASTTGGGSGTTGGATTGAGSGTTGGSAYPCTPGQGTISDSQCNDLSKYVCDSSGKCISNCNTKAAGWCYPSAPVCLANGHCAKAAGSSSSTSGSGGTTGGGSTTGGSGSTTGGTTTGGGGTTTGGGTTGGGGTTTGGTTTGGTVAPGCSAATAANEFATCAKASDCGCPLGCVQDAQLGPSCEYLCSQTSGCPDLATICTTGGCTLDFCGTGTTNGSYDGLCASATTTDGTCVPQQIPDAGSFGACVQGGSATTTCSTNSTTRAAGASALCAPGTLCDGTTCVKLCDPTAAASGCPTGESCNSSASNPSLGACQGGADGGVADGGTSCAADAGTPGTACTTNGQCSCPLNCVALQSGSFCVNPCSSYQDCQVYEECDTTVSPHSCLLNGCPNTDGGTAFSPCHAGDDSAGKATGSCVPYSDGTNPYGLCWRAGTSKTSCSLSQQSWSSAASSLCVAQDLCLSSSGTKGQCFAGCDPTGTIDAPTCAGTTTCNSVACDPTTDSTCNLSATPPCNAATDPNFCDPYLGYCQ